MQTCKLYLHDRLCGGYWKSAFGCHILGKTCAQRKMRNLLVKRNVV